MNKLNERTRRRNRMIDFFCDSPIPEELKKFTSLLHESRMRMKYGRAMWDNRSDAAKQLGFV